jgi:protocatechuate 3,4-dioxygenase beta subunit
MLSILLLLVIGGAQSQSARPPRDAPATDSAAISGRIVDQATALPLPRIVVRLQTNTGSKSLQAITDDDGRYVFTGLDAGKYVLSAGPDEHRSTYLAQRFGDTVSAVESLDPGRPNIELKSGEVRSGVDIGLSRALAIEGHVWDPWDQPMASVEVTVTRADGRSFSIRVASSDDLGVYRVYGLAPGRYHVCANARTRLYTSATSSLARTCHPASVVEREAGDVLLTSHDASGIDIRVQRVGGYSISGSVLDGAGAAVAGAGVGAYSLDDFGASSYATSRSGEFVLKGLTPGRYTIRAAVGGAPPGDTRPPVREMEVGYAAADLGAVDATGIVVMLSKPATVLGRVVFDGNPAPRATGLHMVVQMRPSEGGLLRAEMRPPFAAVNDNLEFALTGLYRLPLAVDIHGLPDGWALKSVRYQGRDITHIATDFGGSPSPTRLEIVVTNHVAHPSVRVTDEQGVAMTSCRVIAVPADPSRWQLALRAVQETLTPDGIVKLGAMLPGDYLIAALPTYEFFTVMREPARIDDLATVATKVSVREGDDRTFELRLINLPPAR